MKNSTITLLSGAIPAIICLVLAAYQSPSFARSEAVCDGGAKPAALMPKAVDRSAAPQVADRQG